MTVDAMSVSAPLRSAHRRSTPGQYSFLSHCGHRLHVKRPRLAVFSRSRLGVAQVTTPVPLHTMVFHPPPSRVPPRVLSLTKTSSNQSIHYPHRLQAHQNNDHAYLPCPSILHQNPPALASGMHHDSLRAPADPHQHGRSRRSSPVRSGCHLSPPPENSLSHPVHEPAARQYVLNSTSRTYLNIDGLFFASVRRGRTPHMASRDPLS